MHGPCDPCCCADHQQAGGKARQAHHQPRPTGQSGERAKERSGQTIGPAWMSTTRLRPMHINAYGQAAEQADCSRDIAPFWNPCVGVRHSAGPFVALAYSALR